MKRLTSLLILFLVFIVAIAACAPAAETVSAAPVIVTETPMGIVVAQTGSILPTVTATVVRPTIAADYENALSLRLLLSLGTLKLTETSLPLTSNQASQLLPLWQGLINLTQSGSSAQEEVNTLLVQIENTLTPQQVAAINAMQLTQVELQAWAQANGIIAGSGGGQGQGQGQGGGGGVSPEARATKQASQGQGVPAGGDNGLSAAIETALLIYLQSLLP
jgi:hypothetical protein